MYLLTGLQLNFTDTWGDLHYLGLTGLEVLGKDGEALPVSLDMMKASPQDLHHLPGHERDDRTLDKSVQFLMYRGIIVCHKGISVTVEFVDHPHPQI